MIAAHPFHVAVGLVVLILSVLLILEWRGGRRDDGPSCLKHQRVRPRRRRS